MTPEQIKARAEAKYPHDHRDNTNASFSLQSGYIAGFTDGMNQDDWVSVETPPKLSGEYLVTYNLEDNQYPLVTSMDYDCQQKTWSDPRGTNEPQDSVLCWKEQPEAKQGIPKEVWFENIIPQPISVDEFERNIYGQCRHGENLASCEKCNGTYDDPN